MPWDLCLNRSGILLLELETCNTSWSHNVFDLRVDQGLRESPNLKNLVSAAIDEQVVILNKLLKNWIKEEFGRFGPALEAKVSEKFQLLEHGLKAQSDQLFRILNDQTKVGQQQSLTAGSGRASGVAAEQAAQVNLVLAEVKKTGSRAPTKAGFGPGVGSATEVAFYFVQGPTRWPRKVATRGGHTCDTRQRVGSAANEMADDPAQISSGIRQGCRPKIEEHRFEDRRLRAKVD